MRLKRRFPRGSAQDQFTSDWSQVQPPRIDTSPRAYRREEICHLVLGGCFLVFAVGFLVADTVVIIHICTVGYSNESVVVAVAWTIAWMLYARIAKLEETVVRLLQDQRENQTTKNGGDV